MNDPEKAQPLLAQEANEETFQEKPAAFQEHFLALEEEQLEEVTGGGKPESVPSNPPDVSNANPSLRRTKSAPAVSNPFTYADQQLKERTGVGVTDTLRKLGHIR